MSEMKTIIDFFTIHLYSNMFNRYIISDEIHITILNGGFNV